MSRRNQDNLNAQMRNNLSPTQNPPLTSIQSWLNQPITTRNRSYTQRQRRLQLRSSSVVSKKKPKKKLIKKKRGSKVPKKGRDKEQKNVDQQTIVEYCTICLRKNAKFCLPCEHKFHKKCISTWIDVKKSCPICRVAFRGNSIDKLKIRRRGSY